MAIGILIAVIWAKQCSPIISQVGYPPLGVTNVGKIWQSPLFPTDVIKLSIHSLNRQYLFYSSTTLRRLHSSTIKQIIIISFPCYPPMDPWNHMVAENLYVWEVICTLPFVRSACLSTRSRDYCPRFLAPQNTCRYYY